MLYQTTLPHRYISLALDLLLKSSQSPRGHFLILTPNFTFNGLISRNDYSKFNPIIILDNPLFNSIAILSDKNRKLLC